MAALIVTAPTTEPLSLAEAKAHLKVDEPDLDPVIASQIIVARHFVEAYTRRALMVQTWDFTYDWNWPCRGPYHRIEIPLQPVMSVTSVTYVDSAGATQTLAADQYQVHEDPTYIVPAYGVTWPSVRCQLAAITVRCVVGYGDTPGDVPAPLREAMRLQLELLHDRDVQARETLEMARNACMDPYRVVRL